MADVASLVRGVRRARTEKIIYSLSFKKIKTCSPPYYEFSFKINHQKLLEFFDRWLVHTNSWYSRVHEIKLVTCRFYKTMGTNANVYVVFDDTLELIAMNIPFITKTCLSVLATVIATLIKYWYFQELRNNWK